MSRETGQNGDLDFEQMMGELAAMKTDLANRQANRVGSRPTTPRVAGADGEPRRTRMRRAATEQYLSSDEAVHNLSVVSNSPAVPSLPSPVIKRSATMTATQHDPGQENDQGQTHEQSQSLSQDQDQSQPLPQEADRSNQEPAANSLANDPQPYSIVPNPHIAPSDGAILSDIPFNLARTESRRSVTPAVPLPPKSAQRSRSISNNSGRLSQISGEGNVQEGLGSPSQEASTPSFSPLAPPRNFLRPYPSSPSLNTSNGQLTPASPRIPARSNSRSVRSTAAAGSQSTLNDPNDPTPASPSFSGGPPPVIPPRARSASRPLSRSNTLIKSDTGVEHSHTHDTPAISEDYEGHSSAQELQEQPSVIEDARESKAEEAPPASQGHMRKKSSNNILQPLQEVSHIAGHALAPSLLPAEAIPPSNERRPQRTPTSEDVDFEARPVIRKQKSVDPAAMYRQQSQDYMMKDLPSISRHASERRPNRERQQSNVSQGGRSREPTQEILNAQERGRSQTSDGSSSKGGIFSWVRSRSKSRDAPSTRPNYDTSHPVPEQPAYNEYNPALIPSRSASSARDKSLPRKPSNPNFQARNEGWPPFPLNDISAGDGHPEGMLPQRSKSFSKPGLAGSGEHPPPFGSSLKVSTNKSTIHHENMIRGMGMGSTPIAPAVLLTPQPSVPVPSPGASPFASPANGPSRGVALAMMKDEGTLSSSELQMQQRHQQLQQAQMQHLQQQQQRLASAASSTSPPATPGSSHNQVFSVSQGPLSPTAGGTAPPTQRLVATRIYIQTETDFKSLNLASDSTALDALQMLQQRGCFGEPGDGRYHDRWTIFEYSKEFLIERPLRDFEIILDVIKTWEADKDNKMICKSFPARDELSAKEVVRLVGPAGQASFVRPQGMVYLETKKSKWEKRYLHATDTAVYHAKDSKGSGERMLCLLKNFDVYAVQVPRKKAPTKFGFALKSSDKIHLFETPEDDYIHYVCLESGDSLREWLAGLRAAKGMFMYHANPEMIRQGQKHAAELLTSASRGNLTEEQLLTTDSKSALQAQGAHSATSATTVPPRPPSPVTLSTKTQDTENATLNSSTAAFPTSTISLDSHSASHSPQTQTHSDSSSSAFTSISTSTAPLLNSANDMATMTSSHKTPFMAGSLLQQRADAEKQEIENMKNQLKMREQAGILGAVRGQNSDYSKQGSSYTHQGGHGRGISSAGSSTSLGSAASSAHSYSLQHQQSQPQLFGGPGTLIEQGEARQLERSKSAGTGLLRPNNGAGANGYSRNRSKSRGPSEDRMPYQGRSTSPHSPGLSEFPSQSYTPPMPQGPLLHFADQDAMIQPGLLLDRAKSSKKSVSPSSSAMLNGYNGGFGSSAQPRSMGNSQAQQPRGRQPDQGHPIMYQNNQGQQQQQQHPQGQNRTRVKPLVDLGNLNTSQDMIRPGLLTNASNNNTSGPRSALSPRRQKPLLDF